MAIKYRHLSRSSSHRQALLRNLVTSLIEHEAISTTYAKAKEAQRLAEKLITLGKRNTGAAKNQAQQIFYEPHKHMPKLFGPLRERYLNRPGGYTRVLRQEPTKDDNAPSAILCLVDGPRDIRFDMTVRAIAREQDTDTPMRELTALNVRKVTRFRANGVEELEKAVREFQLRDKRRELRQDEAEENEDKQAQEHEDEDDWEDVEAQAELDAAEQPALRSAAAARPRGIRVGGSRKARREARRRTRAAQP